MFIHILPFMEWKLATIELKHFSLRVEALQSWKHFEAVKLYNV